MNDSSTLSIRLFATLKEKAGQSKIEIPFPVETTVLELRTQIAAHFPQLAEDVSYSVVSVNRAFAEPHTAVSAKDEVALFPPVSGG